MLRDSTADSLSATLRFLSAAGRLLAASLDTSRSLPDVAELTVPTLADYAAILTFDDGRGAELAAEAGGEGDTFSAIPALTRVRAAAGLDENGGFEHLVDLPLLARDRMLGVLRLGRCTEAFSPTDLAIAEELALRIGVAIDAARIYAREHHVADTLQRALLPERLPQRPGRSIAAAYRPGTTEAIVGGDWYDAFELPDGRLALSIGDVAGHGLRAAVVMGEVRQAFRAASINPKSPSEVLDRANMIVNMRENPTMVTALFAIFDPATTTLTYATAGHPAPVLATTCGLTHVLPGEGIALGVAPATEARDWTFTLAPGTLIALYTDGLIEYDRDPLHGEARLVEAVEAEAATRSDDPARALHRAIFASRNNTDDVATLTLRIEESWTRPFRFEFSAIPLAAPLVRRALRSYLERLDISEDDGFAILTAVGEAVANAVEHAYAQPGQPGSGLVWVEHEGESIAITVEDHGRWRAAQRRDERGRGLPLMRSLMDGVEIRTSANSTTVRLVKRLAGSFAIASSS